MASLDDIRKARMQAFGVKDAIKTVTTTENSVTSLDF